MKKTLIIALLALIAVAGQAQNHLPEISYSKKPAVLSGRIIKDGAEAPDTIYLRCLQPYTSGMGDALWRTAVPLDSEGKFKADIPMHITTACTVWIGDLHFDCYVVPGKEVSFILNLRKQKRKGLSAALTFDGELPQFNHDFVYAQEHGIDPKGIYMDIEQKRNMGQLHSELPEKSEKGYFDYLDATRERTDKIIDADKHIGTAYREFAKAVNVYMYGSMIPHCGQAIQYAGFDDEAAYDAHAERLRSRIDQYMQGDPWANPVLSYVMWHTPDTGINSYVTHPIKLPDSYQQCYLASKYMEQIGYQKMLLSKAQLDTVRTLMPELDSVVLAYNDRLEQELSFINKQGLSRICSLPDGASDTDDILSVLLKPYRGRPVLLDLWETTCGICRMAFKEMHEKKMELAGRIHFVNIASENSDFATWQNLIPNYVGDHYRLTKQQLQALHRQLPCETSGVPIFVLINADGTIHHAFSGWGNIDKMMKEITPVLK